MNGRVRQIKNVIYSAVVAVLLPAASHGADAPDAGRLMDEIKKAPTIERSRPAPQIPTTPLPAEAPPVPEGVAIEVKGFRVTGNSVIDTAELEALLPRYDSQKFTLKDMEQLASVITAVYREKGYLTSFAYIPRQEVTSGIIEIAVAEGKLLDGSIKLLEDPSLRLDRQFARDILTTAMPGDVPLRKQNLERGLLLVNDLPGITAKSTITPGATASTSELLVDIKEGAMFSSSLGMDDYGSRYSGLVRGTATVNYNNPSGRGDLASLSYVTSGENMNYVRSSYTIPINTIGTKAGVAFTWMGYTLGQELEPQDLYGNATTISGYLTHTIVRSLATNLSATLNYDYKMLTDHAATLISNDKQIQVVTLGLTGDQSDTLFSGGSTSGSLTLTGGNLDLSGSATALTQDSTTARSNGAYSHANLSLNRTQYMPANFSVALLGSYQMAFDNLDSSEKLSLGGPNGVRAFPSGEANGDSGYTLSGELRYDIALSAKHTLQLSGFFDYGSVTLHKNSWPGWQGTNSTLPSDYSLSGAGIGILLRQSDLYALKASWAWKLSDNPGAVNGMDGNGKNDIGQLWLQASLWF